jgi:hypothetical protein
MQPGDGTHIYAQATANDMSTAIERAIEIWYGDVEEFEEYKDV